LPDPRTWTSVLAGAGVSLACALVWWAGAAWARRGGGSRRFLVAHLGGMGVRLALAAGLTAWALAALDLRPGLFLLALLGSYALLLVAEVMWILRNRRLLGGRAAARGETRR